MKYGPVDVVVLAIGEPKFDGTILDELEKLTQTGTIRILDAMIVLKDLEGATYGVDIEDLPAQDKARLGFIETGTRGLFDSEDSATFAEGLVPGSGVIALAIENAWAVPLMNSWIDAGVELAMHTRIPAVVIEDRLSALASE